jgi:hypothetical protein
MSGAIQLLSASANMSHAIELIIQGKYIELQPFIL